MCEKVVNKEASDIEHDIVVLGVLEYQWYKRFFPVRRYGPVGESVLASHGRALSLVAHRSG